MSRPRTNRPVVAFSAAMLVVCTLLATSAPARAASAARGAPDATATPKVTATKQQAIAAVRQLLVDRSVSCELRIVAITATAVNKRWRVRATVVLPDGRVTVGYSVGAVGTRPVASDPVAADVAAGCPDGEGGGSDGAVGSRPAEQPNWRTRRYLRLDQQRYYITLNSRDWTGARRVPLYRGDRYAEAPGDQRLGSAPWPGNVRHSVWAPTCTRAPQRVTFTRTVFVPGPPDTMRLSLDAVGSQFPWRPPITRAELRLNGVLLVGENDGAIHRDLTRAQLAKFHYGANKLEIDVTKGRSLPCNLGSTATTRAVGVGLEMYGTFASNIETASLIDHQARCCLGKIHLRNVGPSGAPEGTFRLTFHGLAARVEPAFAKDTMVWLGSGTATCAIAPSTGFGIVDGTCTWKDLPPGAEAELWLGVFYTPPTGDFFDDYTWSWEASTWGRADPAVHGSGHDDGGACSPPNPGVCPPP